LLDRLVRGAIVSPTFAALRLERLVVSGRGAELLGSESAGMAETIPELAFVLGRAAEYEQDFGRARELYDFAITSADQEVAQRATAHLAYLDYFAGNFHAGVRRASSAATGPGKLGRVEALLSLSVNELALNRSSDALSAALAATHGSQQIRLPFLRLDIRFRASRQLVHVLIARGAYRDASAEAERAHAIARRAGGARELGVAAYLRGLVRTSTGQRSGLAYLREADRLWGGRQRSFGRWVRYVWAAALRDQGDLRAAEELRLTTPVKLGWEEPLFELAGGRIVEPETAGRPPDEVPFLNATLGLLRLASGDLAEARVRLKLAIGEFELAELDHYRRGASLTLAAVDLQDRPREAAERIDAEMTALMRFRIMRWPWWHRPASNRLRAFCLTHGVAVPYWRDLMIMDRPGDLDSALRSRDLTEREMEAVALWVADPDLSRPVLAQKLGVAEATVRTLLNRARRKLGVSARRGPEALRLRLEELRAASNIARRA
jgi:DNA-binding CsgD family transcriptional regulator